MMSMIRPAGEGYDPGVSPNWTFFPFMGVLEDLVGGSVAVALLILVLAMILCGATWAFGSHNDHGRMTQAGKWGLVVCVVAAFVVGGAGAIVQWAAEAGSGI